MEPDCFDGASSAKPMMSHAGETSLMRSMVHAASRPMPPAPTIIILRMVFSFEFGHCGLAIGVYAAGGDELRECAEEDQGVEGEGSVVHVPDVVGELAVPVEKVAPVDLRPAGDAGAHFVSACLLGGVAGKISHGKRAGADERHLPGEDVEELREFIQRRSAEKSSEARKALGVGLVARAHRAQLEKLERDAALAGAGVAEEDGAAVDAEDCERREAEDWQPERRADEDEDGVEEALQD